MNSHPSLTELISLQGKTALITGAAKGIGKAAALRLAEAGCSIIALDRDKKSLQTLQQDITLIESATYSSYVVDLVDTAAILDFWDTLKVLPDILINNAGIFIPSSFTQASESFIDTTMQINLNAPVIMCQQFISRREHQGGTIINVSSIEAKMAFKKDMAIYAVSKAGILALTHSLASEYGNQGFKINVIIPGGINTPGTFELGVNALKNFKLSIFGDGIKFHQRLPIGRFGDADEVARVILFLSSSMSDYMQGAEIAVDGGFLVA